jgi:haloalkane dehalogenase
MRELPPSLRVLYPFQTRHFSTSAGRLSYIDEGQGTTLVFLHGNPTWSFLWREAILDLRGSYRCLAVDHLGCGLSDKPEAEPYSLAEHIARTVAWIRSLTNGPVHLVAHDWGGAISVGVARELGKSVRSLSLLNTAAFRFARIPLRISVCRWPIIGVPLVRGANAFVRAAGYMTTERPLSPAVRAGYAFPYNSWANRVAVNRFVQDIPMGPKHPSWETLGDVEAHLQDWRERPVQLIWGLQDWCFNKAILAEWRRRLPNALVHAYADAGHLVHEDRPGALSAHLRQIVAFVKE